MNKFIFLAILLVAVFLAGCLSSEPLLNAKYVSTKHKTIDPSKGVKVADVSLDENESVCNGEDGFGLMETAVNRALAKAPGATYLKNASFTRYGNCVVVEGEAYAVRN